MLELLKRRPKTLLGWCSLVFLLLFGSIKGFGESVSALREAYQFLTSNVPWGWLAAAFRGPWPGWIAFGSLLIFDFVRGLIHQRELKAVAVPPIVPPTMLHAGIAPRLNPIPPPPPREPFDPARYTKDKFPLNIKVRHGEPHVDGLVIRWIWQDGRPNELHYECPICPTDLSLGEHSRERNLYANCPKCGWYGTIYEDPWEFTSKVARLILKRRKEQEVPLGE